MQRSAFIIALFSLFALFSLALASPLPVQVRKEMRETTIELSTREVPGEHEILLREVAADIDSGVKLQIVAREHRTFEDYVREMTGETYGPGDIQDMEPRICRGQQCQ